MTELLIVNPLREHIDNRTAEYADRAARRAPTIAVDWQPAWQHVLKKNGRHVDGLCADVGCVLVLHGMWSYVDEATSGTPRDRERWRSSRARERKRRRDDARAAFT